MANFAQYGTFRNSLSLFFFFLKKEAWKPSWGNGRTNGHSNGDKTEIGLLPIKLLFLPGLVKDMKERPT